MNSRLLPTIALISAAAIWGSMYVVSRIVLMHVPSLPLVCLRIIFALIALAPIAIHRKIWRITKGQFVQIALIGITGYTCSLSLLYIGTAATSATLASLISTTAPPFIVLFAALFGEKPSIQSLIALSLALIGVLFMIGVNFRGHASFAGIAALLGASLTWALYTVLGGRLAHSVSPFTALFFGLVIGGIALIPISLPSFPTIHTMLCYSPLLWLGIGYLGVVAMALAFFLWNYGFANLPSDVGSIYYLFQPVVATILGVSILHEKVTFLMGIGGCLILASAFLMGFSKKAANI